MIARTKQQFEELIKDDVYDYDFIVNFSLRVNLTKVFDTILQCGNENLVELIGVKLHRFLLSIHFYERKLEEDNFYELNYLADQYYRNFKHL
jgi:hypothetical protein